MFFIGIFPGDYCEDETPVPIPNTEVKGLSGDGTVGDDHGRVARCRGYFFGTSGVIQKSFFFCRVPNVWCDMARVLTAQAEMASA